ncbi:PREDICTED: uncharacterized protein LOC103325334 [Prunus mume]|uniref:Uncharacterized protein LOC103325334 n=1 Tax=Prunus mume TaxID=102107 RepID=A0ABM0NJI4_PRUMU|nr:PREDICTED: uncharacterized protein LOC103325334 [Prunus mume]
MVADIDDAEVIGYLNIKQAVLFKRMIWEAMNKDYDKEKSRKRARMAKKATRAKKLEKAVKVSTVMDTKNRLSSKINYDALDKLNGELGYAPGDMQLSNEKKAQSLIVAIQVICNCQMRRTILKAVRMMILSMKVMDTVKRLKPDKAMMMIHMLQMTNIMDATMMTNTIMMRNAILTNYDSNKK